MKRSHIVILLLSLALLLCLTACTGSGEGSGTTAPDASETEPETEAPVSDSTVLTIASGKQTSFKIVNGTATADDVYALRLFAEDLSKKLGAKVEIIDESKAESEFEILVGKLDGRKESAEYYSALSYTEYGIEIVGNKIVIGYYSPSCLERCLNLLEEAIKKNPETGDYEIKRTYRARYNLSTVTAPVLETEGRMHGVYSCGSRNYEASFENVSAEEYNAYLSALASADFKAHQTNAIGQNRFGTYLKGNTQVNVCWYPSKALMKIIYGPKGYLPATAKEDIANTVTPTLTQMGINAVDTDGAAGMSYVIQMSDGRYILIDGGQRSTVNEEKLLTYLKEHHVGEGKPVIAAWFITHPHGDHLSLAQAFIERYHEEIEIQAVAYNFPDLDTNKILNEDSTPLNKAQTEFKTWIKNCFPKANTIVMHTGMRFWIGDVEFEVLGTHEDFYPNIFSYGNDTNTAFRMYYGGKNYTFLGDSDYTLSGFMASVYGAALKCDVMQVAHHGYNGATMALYQALDPDICFWPNYEENFLGSSKCLGTAPGFEYNAWLRDPSVKERVFYTASANHTVTLG